MDARFSQVSMAWARVFGRTAVISPDSYSLPVTELALEVLLWRRSRSPHIFSNASKGLGFTGVLHSALLTKFCFQVVPLATQSSFPQSHAKSVLFFFF